MILGTHHGVTFSHLQEYCDQFSWRYCHRQGDAFADLLYDIVRWPHTSKHLLSNLMSVQEPMGSKEFKETYSNWKLRKGIMEKLNTVRTSLCSLLSARTQDLLPAIMTND